MKKIYNKHLILIRLSSSMKKWPYKRGYLPWGDNSVIFYFLIASEIWPAKREWPCKKWTTVK